MFSSYQNIPSQISPYIIDIGFLQIHWYGAMYIAAFATVTILSLYRLKKERFSINKQQLLDYMTWAIIGLLIGARVGYVLFYDLGYYLANPLQIIWPFSNGELVGIAGMSYHGGLIGTVLATMWFSKKEKINLWELISLIVPTIPLGYTFGRIGNFLNSELYGRETLSPLGMNFGDGILRHPSQLYEAFFEGIVLFIILWSIRKKDWAKNHLLAFYIMGYAIARFGIEFVREPDEQLGLLLFNLSMGQILSIAMFVSGLGLYFYKKSNQ